MNKNKKGYNKEWKWIKKYNTGRNKRKKNKNRNARVKESDEEQRELRSWIDS